MPYFLTASYSWCLLFLFLSSTDFLYLPVCVSSFQGSRLPSGFNCLMELRRVVDFLFFFFCPAYWSVLSSLFLSFTSENSSDELQALYMLDLIKDYF